MINQKFWQGKKVFMTGHTGFKGTWLTILLKELGAEVTGYSLAPNSKPALFDEVGAEKILHKSIIGDIRDAKAMTTALLEAEPEIIFHLAAQPLVLKSYEDPLETFSTNVMGTAYLLNACRQLNGLQVIVNVTTDKVYKNESWPWPYRETDRLGGNDPYSASKACSELISESIKESFFKREFPNSHYLATARAGNVIGGGDWSKDRLIPDMIKSIFSGQPMILRNPTHIRPWQHVLDSIYGYVLLAEKMGDGKMAGAWNFAPENVNSVNVETLAKMLISEIGQGKYEIRPSVHAVPESSILKLDNFKAKTFLGWIPQYPINAAVALTAQWYKDFYQGKPAYNICCQQMAGLIKHEV